MVESSNILTKLDDTSTGIDFLHMLIERMLNLEMTVDRLSRSLDRLSHDFRGSELFLRPETRYTKFNDGYRLHWTLFGEVLMRTKGNDGNKLVPIDDIHLDAMIFGTGQVIKLPTNEGRLQYFGHPKSTLTLRRFIKETHDQILNEQRVSSQMTYKQYLSVKQQTPTYPLGLDDDEFRGLKQPFGKQDYGDFLEFII